MNAKTTNIISIIGAAICGAAFTALQSQGGFESLRVDGQAVDQFQLANLLGILSGGAGALFGFLNSKTSGGSPSESLSDFIRKPRTPNYITAMISLQGLRAYFGDLTAAKQPLDTLAQLAWQVDSKSQKPAEAT